MFIILPPIQEWSFPRFIDERGANRFTPRFHYHSGTNTEWLSVEQIRTLLREQVDPAFKPVGAA